MTAADEEWVKAAMADDTMVVDLLVRLHGGAARSPHLRLPPEWSVRQRRSKSVSSFGNGQKKAQAESASPATPLSWSGGTSLSGGSGGSGGGEESSSRPPTRKPSTAARSKDNSNRDKNVPKRPRKKKTLAELKEEENLLQKEKRELKREIAALHMNLEEQKATNEHLKRMKIGGLSLSDRLALMAEGSIPDQPKQKITAHDNVPCNGITPQPSTLEGCTKPSVADASDPTFFLPDLNIAFEENP